MGYITTSLGGDLLAAQWTGWQINNSGYWTNEFNHIVQIRIPYSCEVTQETMEEVLQKPACKLFEMTEVPNALNAYQCTAFRHTLQDYLRKKKALSARPNRFNGLAPPMNASTNSYAWNNAPSMICAHFGNIVTNTLRMLSESAAAIRCRLSCNIDSPSC